MRVAVFGSWRSSDDDFSFQGSKDEFEKACQEIGKGLARLGQPVIVYSESQSTVDYHIVRGIVEVAGGGGNTYPLVEVHSRAKKERPFTALAAQHPDLFRFHPQSHVSIEAAHLISIRESDAVITMGGGKSTYVAGIATIVARKPLAPIASFGGASGELIKDLKRLVNIENTADFDRLNNPWSLPVRDAAFQFIGATPARSKVFLGYCSK